jgi:hypothetical protein
MGLSHILFPDMYRAYYKMYRGDLLPKDKQSQFAAQQRLLKEMVFMMDAIKYVKENNVVFSGDALNTLQSLPIRSYEEIYPWIDRVWHGEEDVLWMGRTKWFAKSSGTTNARSKYIPVLLESLEQNHFLGGRDMLASYLENNPESKLGFDSVLTVSGSIQDRHIKNGNCAGDVSAIMDANSPWWTQLSKALPKSILDIRSWEERLPKVLDFTKNVDIKAFAGVTSWVNIIIEEAVKKSGKNNALEVWPNLEVFFHGGVNIKPYLNELKKLIPTDKFKYVEVYNASEGFFAYQDLDDIDAGMLLLTGHGIFYEFRNIENDNVSTIEDIKINEKYELIISTVSGLWRYSLGDIIEIVNLDPIRIKVVGRTKAVLNTYGEELMVGNVDEAIKNINEKYGYYILEYTGTTIYKNETQNGGHEWVMETELTKDNLDLFTKHFDEELCLLNSDYAAKRKGGIILSSPVVHFVPKGTFYEWMKNRNKLGGQNKIPRLSEKREFLEDIIKIK